MIKVEIKDSDLNGRLTVELKDLLLALPAEAKQLSWSILDLEAAGDLGPDKNMLDLERKIKESPLGLQVDWDELLRLANSFFQVINTTIVGIKPGNQSPRLVEPDEIYTESEIVIEMIDSSVWIVSAKDHKSVRNVERAFRETELLSTDVA